MTTRRDGCREPQATDCSAFIAAVIVCLQDQ